MKIKDIKPSKTYFFVGLPRLMGYSDGDADYVHIPVDDAGKPTTFGRLPRIFRRDADADKAADKIGAYVYCVGGDVLRGLIAADAVDV